MSTTKRKVDVEKVEYTQEVAKPKIQARISDDEVKRSADEKLFSALGEIGFHVNEWSFEPRYIRYVLLIGTSAFFLFTIVAFIQGNSTIFGTYFWMFLCYSGVFGALLYFWYFVVEHGGGRFLFSPGWRDSYVLTDSTKTNYLVKVYIGYDDMVSASIPYNSFVFEEDKQVDHFWLADEIESQLAKEPLYKK